MFSRAIGFWTGCRYIDNEKVDLFHESVIAKEVHYIMHNLQRGLQDTFPHEGKLIGIGSCFDGSKKVGVNDVDAHFRMDEKEIVIGESKLYESFNLFSNCGEIHVHKNGAELDAESIHRQFLCAVNKVVSEMELPEEWAHGGYATPYFSGVRCNGPAVTALFRRPPAITQDTAICTIFPTPRTPVISIDISLAIPLTHDLQVRSHFFSFPYDLKCKWEKYFSVRGPEFVPYLVADPIENVWVPTTVRFETELLYRFQSSVMMNALRACKGLVETMTIKECQIPQRKTVNFIMGEFLDRILVGYFPERHPEQYYFLNRCMPYLHGFLTATRSENYSEKPKHCISINTAAVKHIILKEAITGRVEHAFDDDCTSCKIKCKDALVQAVFKELADESSFYTQHAFFDDQWISKFSTSVPVTDIKEDLAYGTQQECQVILEKLTKAEVS